MTIGDDGHGRELFDLAAGGGRKVYRALYVFNQKTFDCRFDMATYCTADIYKGGKGENAKAGDLVKYDEEQTRTKAEGQTKWHKEGIPEAYEGQRVIVVRNKVAGNENEAGSVKASVEARVAEKKGARKVRKDAVTHLVARATMPDYSSRSPEEREEFVRRAMKFMAVRYGGEENIVDCRWHFDQSTPHLHFTIVPITADGRLSAKELFKPTKKNMRRWQKEWFEEVAKPLGYDEPDFGRSQENGYTKECVASRRQAEATRRKTMRVVATAAKVAERERARAASAAEEAQGQEARRDEAVRAAEEAERRQAAAEARAAALAAERAQLDAEAAAAWERAQAASQKAKAADERAIVATSRASAAERRLERLQRAAQVVARGLRRAKADALRGLRALARRCWGGASRPPMVSNAVRIAVNSNKPQVNRGNNEHEIDRTDHRRAAVRHRGR